MGSGAGHLAVRLVQAHGACVTGIELSPSQHERAVTSPADVQGVQFVQGDVAEYLAGAEPFDAAYAIGTLGFIDPHRSLSALRDGLRPGAPLILSLLVEHAPATEGGRVLDAGCGTGELAVFLASLGHSVEAADFAEGALDRARAEHAEDNVRWLCLDPYDSRTRPVSGHTPRG
ncbi:class I SAM-dependent methyltransferase [Streptomyces sp. NBC_01275]|uniref:class I SAM-dependent methyltransferase n=1 Tax=Streptomyces sp. NBC_01275 TaxID=2903807 RepID=UPI0022561976|nr:class I SAM-dependent methyltransferase [Streptomyces sp. NBC_01275]MCX4759999.1 class I SAM-dependent methyltransferase [Streptomyces sp. NBC_01275]